MNKQQRVLSYACVASVSYLAGALITKTTITTKLQGIQPLLSSALLNIFDTVTEDNMTAEEITECVKMELSFLQIILRDKNASAT